MFTQQLRKEGDTYFVTIPRDEVEQRGLREGQFVTIQVTEIEERQDLADDIRNAIDERWERNEPALRYLADR
jgi:antitoxin component of MazEF toxin-antitoxin module